MFAVSVFCTEQFKLTLEKNWASRRDLEQRVALIGSGGGGWALTAQVGGGEGLFA